MGGDRDGNPNVTAETTRDVVIIARLEAANAYFKVRFPPTPSHPACPQIRASSHSRKRGPAGRDGPASGGPTGRPACAGCARVATTPPRVRWCARFARRPLRASCSTCPSGAARPSSRSTRRAWRPQRSATWRAWPRSARSATTPTSGCVRACVLGVVWFGLVGGTPRRGRSSAASYWAHQMHAGWVRALASGSAACGGRHRAAEGAQLVCGSLVGRRGWHLPPCPDGVLLHACVCVHRCRRR